MRTRKRPGLVGWLAVFCPLEEEQRRSDPRMRMLLEERGRSAEPNLQNPGPVIVIERDGVVRRLLTSQIERVGAICYPSDDLPSALRLLAAEPRAETVLIDFTLAGAEMCDWVEQIRVIRPEAILVGTGGVGAESDLLAQGVSRVLRKPWRIMDLVEAIER
jgi:DNA-binding NtrC family response regulator